MTKHIISKSFPVYITVQAGVFRPSIVLGPMETVADILLGDHEILYDDHLPLAQRLKFRAMRNTFELTGIEQPIGFGHSLGATLNHTGETLLTCQLLPINTPVRVNYITASFAKAWIPCSDVLWDQTFGPEFQTPKPEPGGTYDYS